MAVTVLEPSERDLLVRVSVVALPTRVSVAAGRVRVPEATAEAATEVVPDDDPAKVAPEEPIAGVVRTGVVIVGEVARTTEPVPVLAVTATPAIEKLLPVPAVSKVLLVRVSVVALPTSVSVAAGKVSVVVPATAEASSVVVPEVVPASLSLPTAPAEPKVLTPVTVSVLPRVMAVPLEAGPVRVTPSGIVKVDPVAGAVIVTLLIVVAVATPRVGVVSVGEVANTAEPLPVSSDTAVAS